jgi:prevent-host-death family protein
MWYIIIRPDQVWFVFVFGGNTMIITNISEAKSGLSHLLDLVSKGRDVVIAKAGKPVARLVAYHQDVRPRTGGQWRGKVRKSEDFESLPEDIMSAFEGANDERSH